MITVQWKIFEQGCEPLCGHGIEFHLNTGSGEKSLIAFIDGFEWHHGFSDKMIVWIRSGLDVSCPDVYATLRDAIDKATADREIISGELPNSLVAWVNG